MCIQIRPFTNFLNVTSPDIIYISNENRDDRFFAEFTLRFFTPFRMTDEGLRMTTLLSILFQALYKIDHRLGNYRRPNHHRGSDKHPPKVFTRLLDPSFVAGGRGLNKLKPDNHYSQNRQNHSYIAYSRGNGQQKFGEIIVFYRIGYVALGSNKAKRS